VDLFRRFHPGERGETIREPPLRLDYIFATEDLAQRAIRCDVLRTPDTERASDHYPVLADFELDP